VIVPEAGAFGVTDRANLDFDRLYRLTVDGAFFVIRGNGHVRGRRLYSSSVDRATGVVRDQHVVLDTAHLTQRYPEALRPGSALAFRRTLPFSTGAEPEEFWKVPILQAFQHLKISLARTKYSTSPNS
jgi:hypothetical protein